MLFAKGKRPDRGAIARFVGTQLATSLSFDPESGTPTLAGKGDNEGAIEMAQTHAEGKAWVELLRDGLLFDLEGLSPSQPLTVPMTDNRYDFDHSKSLAMYDAMRLIPGTNLAGGEHTLPVVRCLISLARDLAYEFDDIAAFVWPPASSVISREFFESTAAAWLAGGSFPALGLTSFRETMDGAMQSVGLEYLIGQELIIEAPLCNDRVKATRLGIRLINQLIMVGGIEKSERLAAPDGSRLIMRFSCDDKFVRVSQE